MLGAVAFALSLQIPHSLPARSFIVSTTLVIVLITTVLLGAFMSAFARCIGIRVEPQTPHDRFRNRSSLHNRWRRFDDNCMKRIFGGQVQREDYTPTAGEDPLELQEQALISTAPSDASTSNATVDESYNSLFGKRRGSGRHGRHASGVGAGGGRNGYMNGEAF